MNSDPGMPTVLTCFCRLQEKRASSTIASLRSSLRSYPSLAARAAASNAAARPDPNTTDRRTHSAIPAGPRRELLPDRAPSTAARGGELGRRRLRFTRRTTAMRQLIHGNHDLRADRDRFATARATQEPG